MKNKLVIFIVPFLFFITSFLTISHYGISWDEPIHFSRGSAYLHYFLTGKLDYNNLQSGYRRSYYQDYSQTGKYFSLNDSGHPPLNGILAALSNKIFYQKLGVLGDIESFHLFNILAASLLVLVVTAFAIYSYGPFVGLTAGITLATYPLFFSEGHFNIKDPAEAAFFGATIWAFWYSLKKYDWRFLFLSIIFFALAFGTKFNILFLPFIVLPWLAFRYGKDLAFSLEDLKRFPLKFLIILLISPVIVAVIFFLSWPYLWNDPVNNTLNIFRYYQEIGTGGRGQLNFLLPGGFNLFPLAWIVITTPPFVLLLTFVGIVAVVYSYIKEKEKTALLWLIWFIVPVLRVSIPNSSIYGGIRQIMEFIPALALLSGLGAFHLSKLLQKSLSFLKLSERFWQVFVVLLFIPQLIVLVKLHPNENVYFNSLTGGLAGASEKNIPYWGNSFGNAYFQAVQWLNKNAPAQSKVALLQGTMVNIPKIYFRPDIDFSNSFWSGINREGEYLLDLTHEGYQMAYPFVWEYVENVLIPVYEVKVDGVSIAKIWKNDVEHSKEGFKYEEDVTIKQIDQKGEVLELELERVYSLARLNIEFNPKGNCAGFKNGIIKTSVDGSHWREASEKISDEQVKEYPSLEKGVIRYIFPANKAKYLKIYTGSEKSCFFQNMKLNLKGF